MIFLDTGYFKGLLDAKDSHHEDSLKIKEYLEDLNETTVINTTVLVETLNRAVGFEDNLNNLYNGLIDENRLIQLNGNDYLKSLEINAWFGNSINYSDCTIIHTMMNLGINRIVSFDSSFKQFDGFKVMSNLSEDYYGFSL